MTATELYNLCPEFQQLIASWVETRYIPFCLGDWLQEHGEERLAAKVRVAAEVVNYNLNLGINSRNGIYPFRTIVGKVFVYAWGYSYILKLNYCHILSDHYKHLAYLPYASAAAAILAYLDLLATEPD